MRPEQELAARNNQEAERDRLIDMAAKLIRDTAAGTPTERAELAAKFLQEASGPEPFAASPLTGSTLYMIERDQWKARALSAESKLDEQQKNWERDLEAARRELDRAGEAATAALIRERNDLQSRLDKSERMYEAAEQHVKILQKLNDECGSRLSTVMKLLEEAHYYDSASFFADFVKQKLMAAEGVVEKHQQDVPGPDLTDGWSTEFKPVGE